MGNGTSFGGLVAAVLGLSVAWWAVTREQTVPAVTEVAAPARADIVPTDMVDVFDRQLTQATESDERLGRYLVLIQQAKWFPVPWFMLTGCGLGLIVWAGSGSWAAAVGVGVLAAGSATAKWFIKLARKAMSPTA